MDYFNNLDARQGLLYMLGTSLMLYKNGVLNCEDFVKTVEVVHSGLDGVLAADYDEARQDEDGWHEPRCWSTSEFTGEMANF